MMPGHTSARQLHVLLHFNRHRFLARPALHTHVELHRSQDGLQVWQVLHICSRWSSCGSCRSMEWGSATEVFKGDAGIRGGYPGWLGR